jgi:protein transport protein SEC24
MPEALYLSSENLNNEGIYLLETGEDAFIFPGRAVSSDILFQLFGVRSVNEIQAKQVRVHVV